MKTWMKVALGIVVSGGAFIAVVGWTAPWVALCPGIQSRDLDTIDESLAGKVKSIMKTLDKEGFDYSVSSVYRSPKKQMCYYEISQVVKKVTGQNGLTGTTKSCHNNTVNGKPASLAIDIHKFSGSMDKKAQFYLRLRELARAKGLTSGGDYRKSNPMWAKYDLGWDPGHVEIKGCASKVRTK